MPKTSEAFSDMRILDDSQGKNDSPKKLQVTYTGGSYPHDGNPQCDCFPTRQAALCTWGAKGEYSRKQLSKALQRLGVDSAGNRAVM